MCPARGVYSRACDGARGERRPRAELRRRVAVGSGSQRFVRRSRRRRCRSSESPRPTDTSSWEPQAADGRLAHTAGADPGGVFTSDLSVSEYVLLGEAGFEPLGFVVGSSIYHIGIQVARWGQNQELQVLTQAMYNARELAMSRMQAEAEHLGADGIVGVAAADAGLRLGAGRARVPRDRHGGEGRRRAPAGAHRAPDGRAFTSDLSAQDFFRPARRGRGARSSFVLGTCVYHIAHQSVMQALRQAGQNQEMMQFTQGIYEARELALSRMQAEATTAQAAGIVGVNVGVYNHVWGEHATEFLATGTAIRRLGDEHRLAETSPKPTFTLGLDG